MIFSHKYDICQTKISLSCTTQSSVITLLLRIRKRNEQKVIADRLIDSEVLISY